jgi:DNA-binding MarR family transcriptional regulator
MNEVEQLRYLILAAQREGNRQLIHALKPLGVTSAQAEVLRILADYAPLTLTGLGELLVCESGTNPSRLVERLVVAGLVQRAAGPGDRREIALTLTARGREVEQRVQRVEAELFAPVGRALPPADLATVVRVLGTIVAGSDSGEALGRRIGPAGSSTASR